MEARAFHPGRTARVHLAALAASNRIPGARSNAAIAAELVVSPGAAEKHVAGIFAKLGLPPPTATTGGPNLRYLGA